MITQEEVHALAVEKGFWNENRSVGECLALVHSEVSEALEEARQTTAPLNRIFTAPDGKPEGFSIELADAVIRIMDLAEAYKIDLAACIELKHVYNKTRSYKHGKKF